MNKKFNQWLAGLIDGDGYFALSKKGYAALEITLETRDSQCLYKIKKEYGGSIKVKGGVKAIRYRLHDKKGMLKIIDAINGEIRNPTRLAQLFKICNKYNIELKYAEGLTKDNAWLSGFIDSDGSIYKNTLSVQIFITISQKNKLLLDLIVPIFGGKVFSVKTTDNFKWIISKKSEVLTLLEYFKENPLYSEKMNRVRLIPLIYECFNKSMHNLPVDTVEGKIWSKITAKWEAYD